MDKLAWWAKCRPMNVVSGTKHHHGILPAFWRGTGDHRRIDGGQRKDVAHPTWLVNLAIRKPLSRIEECDPTVLPLPTAPSSEYRYLQKYLDEINADYACNNANFGDSIKIVDIESGVAPYHFDYPEPVYIGPANSGVAQDHGASVFGILNAYYNNYGIDGIASSATVMHAGPVNIVTDGAAIISTASAYTTVGDIILIEMAIKNDLSDPYAIARYPVEYVSDNYAALRTAVALGRIIAEDSGNDGLNLDTLGEFTTARADSGAIMVGAGTAFTRRPITTTAWATSYGSRVDVQGWGECVATASTDITADLYSGLYPGPPPPYLGHDSYRSEAVGKPVD